MKSSGKPASIGSSVEPGFPNIVVIPCSRKRSYVASRTLAIGWSLCLDLAARAALADRQPHPQVRDVDREGAVRGPRERRVAAEQLELDRVPGLEAPGAGVQLPAVGALGRGASIPRATRRCLPSGATSQRRAATWASAGAAPLTVEVGAQHGRRRAASAAAAAARSACSSRCPGSVAAVVSTQPSPPPAAGSSAAPICGSPPSESSVCGGAARGSGARRARGGEARGAERARAAARCGGRSGRRRATPSRGERGRALQVVVEPVADRAAAGARARPACSRRAGGRSRRAASETGRVGVALAGPVREPQHLVDREEVVGEAEPSKQRRRRGGSSRRSRREWKRASCSTIACALGVVVGLAGVGARDPAGDVGLGVGARRRQVAHRPARDERLADRLPGADRELRRRRRSRWRRSP